MTTITVTFLEDFIHLSFAFLAGEVIEAEWLGGGDVVRIKYAGKIVEIPTSIISYTIERIER